MTQTLDRITPPPVGAFPPLSLPRPDRYRLTNGIEVIACNQGDEEVCRIDLMFDGGYYAETLPGTAALTLLMLKEGAAGKSSETIAEALDYHGAWLQTSASSHYLYVTLYTLNRHLDTCVSLLADIVARPDFPQPEFDRVKERRIQQLLVQNEKVDVLAGNTFPSMLFGENHPYGRTITPAHLASLTPADLATYHRRHIRPDDCHIFIAGKITDRLLDNLERHFGPSWQVPVKEPQATPLYPVQPSEQHIVVTHKEHALQSGIRIGLPVINRDHPDFFALKLLCATLGGYFGSRLMSNIREEKGYTYGIASTIAAMPAKRGYPCRRTHGGQELPARRDGAHPRLALLHRRLLPVAHGQQPDRRLLCPPGRGPAPTHGRRPACRRPPVPHTRPLLPGCRRRPREDSRVVIAPIAQPSTHKKIRLCNHRQNRIFFEAPTPCRHYRSTNRRGEPLHEQPMQ